MKIIIINLERRVERKTHCVNEFRKINIEPEFFPAKDSLAYKPLDTEKALFGKADFLNKPEEKGIICNFLSHMEIWKNIDSPTIISQDDVIISENFTEYVEKIINNMPSNTEIIWLALPHDCSIGDRYYDSVSITENIDTTHRKPNPCSTIYIITPKGAQNIIEYTLKNGVKRATDGHINDYLHKKGLFYFSNPILGTVNTNFTSDIFHSVHDYVFRLLTR